MKKTLIGLAAISLFDSCTQTQGWFGSNKTTDSTQIQSEGSYKAKFTRDASITKENAYSDLFLDSAALDAYQKKENITGDKAERMREFYLVRNDGFAWFTSNGPTEQARALWSLYGSESGSKKDEPAGATKGRMDSLMINDSLFHQATDTSLRNDPSETGLAMAMAAKDSFLTNTELALTAQFVQMATEKNNVVTEDNLYWLVPRKKTDAMQLADSVLNKGGDSVLGSTNQQYAALKNALKFYYDAAKNGGWQAVPATKGLRKGVKSPAVVLLKKRLAATNDYMQTDTSNVFTDSLVTAIKNVQTQYGFASTGVPGDSLLTELNVPAQERVQQILVNMNRALWTKPVPQTTHLAVNIPSLQLMAYGDTGKTLQLPVVIGKEGTGTIAFSGEISQVVFSPYWNIPQSIVQREIKPAMQKDPAYLQKHHMEIVRQHDTTMEIRQLPGKDNALGTVKFLFPNSFDIYLHDTPDKSIFAQKNRAVSHGCIRVAHPDSLAHFVLRSQSEWTPEKIQSAMNSGKEEKVDVKNPVPVVITYYTAWADENGRMNFRKDVYGYDKKTAAQMFSGGQFI